MLLFPNRPIKGFGETGRGVGGTNGLSIMILFKHEKLDTLDQLLVLNFIREFIPTSPVVNKLTGE